MLRLARYETQVVCFLIYGVWLTVVKNLCLGYTFRTLPTCAIWRLAVASHPWGRLVRAVFENHHGLITSADGLLLRRMCIVCDRRLREWWCLMSSKIRGARFEVGGGRRSSQLWLRGKWTPIPAPCREHVMGWMAYTRWHKKNGKFWNA